MIIGKYLGIRKTGFDYDMVDREEEMCWYLAYGGSYIGLNGPRLHQLLRS
jgi:hypothetical protein